MVVRMNHSLPRVASSEREACSRRTSLKLATPLCAFLVLLALAVSAPSASAAPDAWWKMTSSATPTDLVPGTEAKIVVQASNVGFGSVIAGGQPVNIVTKLPTWLTPTAISGVVGEKNTLGSMSCELADLTCTYAETLAPFVALEVLLTVQVAGNAPATGVSEATIEGGEIAGTTTTTPLTTSTAPTPFGVNRYELAAEDETGASDIQAGSHPFQLTAELGLNQKIESESFPPLAPTSPALVKDLHFQLPAGLVGNATVIPQCTDAQFTTLVSGAINLCPADAAVGVALATVNEPVVIGYATVPAPIFNLTPTPGEPARFGIVVEGVPVVLDTSVRTGTDYGVTVSVNNVTQAAALIGSQVTFWGTPGDPRHNESRGWSCVANRFYVLIDEVASEETCNGGETSPKAFLSMPTSCSGPLATSVEVDSWDTPGSYLPPIATTVGGREGQPGAGLAGCNRLSLSASLAVTADRSSASTPSGLTVHIHVPQAQALNPTSLRPSDLQSTTVQLPLGMQVNPAAANGLSACSEAQIGLHTGAEPQCPEASKVATVEIDSPLLANPLKGAVYLATQKANPFGSLIALYLAAKDPVSGVLVKLPGQVTLDPVTGQLTTTFANTPQVPFEDVTIHFFDGPHAALTTPARCNTYHVTGAVSPWSGGEALPLNSSFTVSSGPSGAACASTDPFQPSFQAGVTGVQAGSFTGFVLKVGRPDGDESLGAVTTKLPEGLLAKLSGVPLCAEAAAAAGTCPEASLIGHVHVKAGLGTEPVSIENGKVYLTTAYRGGEFGLSIVTEAKAGPFDLGLVVVRASIAVDPASTEVTVISDPLPTILEGVPLQIQQLTVSIDRPGFLLNPTSCEHKAVDAALVSSSDAAVGAESPFQVTGCARLGFAPKLTASTPGHTSRVIGAGLSTTLSYPVGSLGRQANLAQVRLDLPRQLATRLTAVHNSCVAATFARGPQFCPAASHVGTSEAISPTLPVPLIGTAYLVSHAGESLPNLVFVMQGYGITVDIVGRTRIQKGVTSETFATVPDVPVSRFTVKLPQGKFSALGTAANLCKRGLKLSLPTAFVAQDGATIHRSTKLAITGCKRAIAKKKSGRKG
jgi:hypothetical protein